MGTRAWPDTIVCRSQNHHGCPNAADTLVRHLKARVTQTKPEKRQKNSYLFRSDSVNGCDSPTPTSGSHHVDSPLKGLQLAHGGRASVRLPVSYPASR
jgi:hypothetical protein